MADEHGMPMRRLVKWAAGPRSPRFWSLLAGIVLLVGAALAMILPGSLDHRHGTVGSSPGGPNLVVAGVDRDVPCDAGYEPPAYGPGCATPVPTLAPDERTLGRPLVVGPFDVALDRLGRYRVRVGEAILVRGMIQDIRLRLGNAADGTYSAPFFDLELEDPVTGSTFPKNVYLKGVVDGLQRVVVYLTFDLQSYRPGAVVRVEHVSVV
jgi:hypothetical protein